jgi:hypothetical protein
VRVAMSIIPASICKGAPTCGFHTPLKMARVRGREGARGKEGEGLTL